MRGVGGVGGVGGGGLCRYRMDDSRRKIAQRRRKNLLRRGLGVGFGKVLGIDKGKHSI